MGKKVIVYSTTVCPYCAAAKVLLTKKGVEFEEINVQTQEERDAMIERAKGARTVPQIFVGDDHIGGFDDLSKLEESGKLDKILA